MKSLLLAVALAALTLSTGCRLFCDECDSRRSYWYDPSEVNDR